jgi:4,5-DOPA dioxygenase extradiol
MQAASASPAIPSRAPVLFISHGAPTFALEPGVLGPRLRAVGEQLAGVRAVLVVSPHWQTRGVRVMTAAAPETVHDFGGFDPALYQLHYPAHGDPELAREAGRLLAEAGYAVTEDPRQGLDHGAWVPLLHLLPGAGVPVFQVSMPVTLDSAAALRLGRALAPLRDRGVAIVASGSLTHNLYEFRQSARGEAAYARQFADWVRAQVLAGDRDRLRDYRRDAPHAERAHPTEEHFLPLLVASGAAMADEPAQVIEGGITHGVLAMDAFALGLPAAEPAVRAPREAAAARVAPVPVAA